MDLVRTLSRRPGGSLNLLGLSRSWSARIAGFVLGVAAIVAAPQVSIAQISNTDTFTRGSFGAAEGEGRGAARSRSSRRNVSTTTLLEDFDVPRRTNRRTAVKTSTTEPTRVVARRAANQRRVRVAALSRNTTTFIDVTPSARTAVQRRTRAVSAKRGSRGGGVGISSIASPMPSLTGGGIAWRASSGCLAGNLRSIVAAVSSRFGPVTVNSTCRSASHNRRVGGARKSWHLKGQAVDFRVRTASIAGLSAYLRGVAGGFKHYGGGRYHIDNGPKRSF